MSFKIQHNDKNIISFRNKIVFAPNGFGKTQFSIYLRNELTNKGENVGLFTSRELEELVKIGDRQIFVGDYAYSLKRVDEIRNIVSENNPIHEDYRRYFDNPISNYYSRSFVFKKHSYSNRSKIDNIFSLINEYYSEDAETVPTDLIYRTDVLLDYDLYERCEKVLEKSVDDIMLENCREELPAEIVNELEKLKDYIAINGKTKCPLCGYDYLSNAELMKNVTNTINSYITNSDNGMLQEINELVLEIRSIMRKKNSTFLKDYFVNSNVKIEDKIGTILYYFKFCTDFESIVFKHFGDLEVLFNNEKTTLSQLSNEFTTKSRELDFKRKQNTKLGSDFSNYVQSEITKLLDLQADNIVITATIDTISFTDQHGKRIKKKCLEFFSESQLKRIALVLIKGYIKFLDYDCIILDDPIDSYDDYYLDIVCSYVSEILTDSESRKWYLFTNNYNFLTKISTFNCGRNYIIYNDNPDFFLDTSKDNLPPLAIRCSEREVAVLNINEMILLSKYSCNKTRVSKLRQSDFDAGLLPFLAFLVTIRNMRDILHPNFDGITVGYAPYVFSDIVTEHIESNFMHYNHKSSRKTTLGDLYNIYVKILDVDNANIRSLNSDSRVAVDCRELVVKSKFSSFTGNKLLNLILYKILILSYLKFCIEDKMISFLLSLKIGVKKVENAHGLGRKIEVAKKKVMGNSDGEVFIKKIADIHSKYSALINDYDHALNRMYPPYLSTSFKDLKKLKDEIFKLDDCLCLISNDVRQK